MYLLILFYSTPLKTDTAVFLEMSTRALKPLDLHHPLF